MPAFTSFNNRLPDPTFGVNDAGALDAFGSRGPGFANVSVQSIRPAQVSRTNGGKGVHRETGAHNWAININYHPMLKDHFDVISSFLDARNGRINPFFVVLPQHSRPKDALFAAYATSNVIPVYLAHSAGSPTLTVRTPTGYTGTPKPGDYFTITDSNDVNHMKAYKINRVENNSNYLTGSTALGANDIRLHVTPPLVRNTANGAVVNFINPQFRVIQTSDVQEYNLNTDNLYSYQLQLEEIQP